MRKPLLLILFMAMIPAIVHGAPVYFNDFEVCAGSEWSSPTTSETPIGNRWFLGKLVSQCVTLTLPTVSAQDLVLEFDLFVIGSWDGNGIGGGQSPDTFSVRVVGGPTLLDTNFSNTVYNQDYPSPGSSPGTGADEKDSLGYDKDSQVYGDSVYHLILPFTHAGGTLQLEFCADLHDQASDPAEYWGLDNVSIVPEPNTLALLLFTACLTLRRKR